MKKISILISLLFINLSYADEPNDQSLKEYCEQSSGQVERMPAQFSTKTGLVEGFSKDFCTFKIDGGFIAVGLGTFASTSPNIAATFIKQLPPISHDSPLFKGKYENPSLNFCKNIGGASIAFLANGGFSNALGQTDMCVFGDGSMVSGWSLIYIANGRKGYHLVRDKIKAEPLAIKMPS
ncbi:Uncharacterised protein [Legionella busanensis]|uniref:Hemolysin n=1 Tax=Legionella busanensis TaxID=190655 RepID=A0A378JRX0_9GAMM|nr:hypothetical protein [Legionella busanensis]STX52889.1 Uncharacterised protein [Legionella busanensis]